MFAYRKDEQDLGMGQCRRVMDYLLSSLAFHPDIGGGIGAVSDLNDCQAGSECRILLLDV